MSAAPRTVITAMHVDEVCFLSVEHTDGELSVRAEPAATVQAASGDLLYALAFGDRPISEHPRLRRSESTQRIEVRVDRRLETQSWETMKDPSGAHVATRDGASIVRVPVHASSARAPLPLTAHPLAVLLSANVRDTHLGPFAVQGYRQQLEPILNGAALRLEHRVLRSSTMDELAQERDPYLIHILAHGDDGKILLEGASDAHVRRPYGEFADHFPRISGLRVVVLHMCESLPLGLLLAQQGLHVLAFNGCPRANLPASFWSTFYERLMSGFDVVDAVGAARRALRDLQAEEWQQLVVCVPPRAPKTALVTEELKRSFVEETWQLADLMAEKRGPGGATIMRPAWLDRRCDLDAVSEICRAWELIDDLDRSPARTAESLSSVLTSLKECQVSDPFGRRLDQHRNSLAAALDTCKRLKRIHEALVSEEIDEAERLSVPLGNNLAGRKGRLEALHARVVARREEVQRLARIEKFISSLEDELCVLLAAAHRSSPQEWSKLLDRASLETPWEETRAGAVRAVDLGIDVYSKLSDGRRRTCSSLQEAARGFALAVLQDQLEMLPAALERFDQYLVARSAPAGEKLASAGALVVRALESLVHVLHEGAVQAREATEQRDLESALALAERSEDLGDRALRVCTALRADQDLVMRSGIEARLSSIVAGVADGLGALRGTLDGVCITPSEQVRVLLAEGRVRKAIEVVLGAGAPPPAAGAQAEKDASAELEGIRAAVAALKIPPCGRPSVDAAVVLRRYMDLFANPSSPPVAIEILGTSIHPYLLLSEIGISPDAPVDPGSRDKATDSAVREACQLLADPERRIRLDVWQYPIESPSQLASAAQAIRTALLAGNAPEVPRSLGTRDRAALLSQLGRSEEAAEILWIHLTREPGAAAAHSLLLCELTAAHRAARGLQSPFTEQRWRRLAACLSLILRVDREEYVESFCRRRQATWGVGVAWSSAAMKLAVEDELKKEVERMLSYARDKARTQGAAPTFFDELTLETRADLEGAASLQDLRRWRPAHAGVLGGRLAVSALGLEVELAKTFEYLCREGWALDRDWRTATAPGVPRDDIDAVVRSFTELWRPTQLFNQGRFDAAEGALGAMFPLADLEAECELRVEGRPLCEEEYRRIASPLFSRVEAAIGSPILKRAAAGLWLNFLVQRVDSTLPSAGERGEKPAVLVRALRRATALARSIGKGQRVREHLLTIVIRWCQSWKEWHESVPPEIRAELTHVPLGQLRSVYYDFFESNRILAGALAFMHHAHALTLANHQNEHEAAMGELEAALALGRESEAVLRDYSVCAKHAAVARAIDGDLAAAKRLLEGARRVLDDSLRKMESEAIRAERQELLAMVQEGVTS